MAIVTYKMAKLKVKAHLINAVDMLTTNSIY